VTNLSITELLADAQVATASGDVNEAERILLRVIRLSGDDWSAWDRAVVAYVRILLASGRTSTAATWMLRSLDRDASVAAWQIFHLIVRSVPSVEALRMLRDIAPERRLDWWDLLRSSQMLARSGRYRVAAAIAQRVATEAARVKDDPNRWRAEGQLGRVYQMASRPRKALHIWRRAFGEGSSNRIIAKRLSQALERNREWQECLDVVSRALQRISDPPVQRTLLARKARVLVRLGRSA